MTFTGFTDKYNVGIYYFDLVVDKLGVIYRVLKDPQLGAVIRNKKSGTTEALNRFISQDLVIVNGHKFRQSYE